MTINASHEGNDPMGALTTHRGVLENCPAPDCQDRVAERQEAWGVYRPHNVRIVERDPDRTDPEGQPVGRLVYVREMRGLLAPITDPKPKEN